MFVVPDVADVADASVADVVDVVDAYGPRDAVPRSPKSLGAVAHSSAGQLLGLGCHDCAAAVVDAMVVAADAHVDDARMADFDADSTPADSHPACWLGHATAAGGVAESIVGWKTMWRTDFRDDAAVAVDVDAGIEA